MARGVQVAALFVALVILLIASGYGFTRGILGEGSAPSRLEIIGAVLDYVREEPCNHPDGLTAKARLTTEGQALETIGNTFGQPYFGGSGASQPGSSTERPVWLVELRGDIQVLGIRGDPNACDPNQPYTLTLYLVDLNGEVTTGYGTSSE